MKNNAEKNLIVGLEIGTSKVVAVVGQLFPDGVVEIIGIGSNPSKGINQGGITDLGAVTNSIQRAIDAAADVSRCKIESVTIAITGEHIHSLNESGVVVIDDNEVTQEDIDRAMTTARSVKMADGLTLLQVIPQEFAVDGRMNITDPLGLQGVRLTAQAHLISCHQYWLANLKKAVERCKTESGTPLKVDSVFYSGFASAQAVLTKDEKDLGVCLIDFGAGTIDISIYTGGKLRLSKALTYAGNSVTKDITYCFSTPFNEAEEIKKEYGSAFYPPSVDPDLQIKLKGATPNTVLTCTKENLSRVTSARYNELLTLVKNEVNALKTELIHKKMDTDLTAGIVITGGGAQIQDLTLCAKEVFGQTIPVRIGSPINISGLTDYVNKPAYATVVGLIHSHHGDHYFIDPIPEEKNLIQELGLKLKKFVNNVISEF